MLYAVACRLCDVTVLYAQRLDDPEAAMMLDHLRAHHPDALPRDWPTDFAAIIPNFRLRAT